MNSTTNKWLVLAIVSVALLLVAIDMTVLYIALPTLTHSLGASTTEKLWIINMYPLVVSGLLLGAGTLGDRVGHKRLFLYGLGIFGMASLLAAYSVSSHMLITSRALLGVGAAVMLPTTLSIIVWTFTDQHQRTLAISIWGAVASGGAAIGPLVGGLLLEHFWWGSVFLINVPIVLLALLLTGLWVRKDQPDTSRPWDFIGSLQIMVALISLAYAIKEYAKPQPSGNTVIVTLVMAIVFGWLFVRRQRHSAHPLLDFALFKSPAFSSAAIAGLAASACLMGSELVLGQRLQLVQGLSPLQAGLYILPLPLGAIVAGPCGGLILRRFGNRRFLIAALLLYALSILAFRASLEAPRYVQVVCLVLWGAWVGLTTSAVSSTIMQSTPPSRAGMAASVEGLAYELGGSLGIAIMGSLTSAIYHRTLKLPAAFTANSAVLDGIDGALSVARSMTTEAGLVLENLAKSAFDTAFFSAMGTAASLLLVVAAAVWLNFRRFS